MSESKCACVCDSFVYVSASFTAFLWDEHPWREILGQLQKDTSLTTTEKKASSL